MIKPLLRWIKNARDNPYLKSNVGRGGGAGKERQSVGNYKIKDRRMDG